MTKKQLVALLDEIAPTYYYQAPIGTKCPFITYQTSNDNNFGADNRVYQRVMSVIIMAYALTTQMSIFSEIEEALDDIYWQSSDSINESERLIIRTYNIEVIETSEEEENGEQD